MLPNSPHCPETPQAECHMLAPTKGSPSWNLNCRQEVTGCWGICTSQWLTFPSNALLLREFEEQALVAFWGKALTYCPLKDLMENRTNQHLASGWIRDLWRQVMCTSHANTWTQWLQVWSQHERRQRPILSQGFFCCSCSNWIIFQWGGVLSLHAYLHTACVPGVCCCPSLHIFLGKTHTF